MGIQIKNMAMTSTAGAAVKIFNLSRPSAALMRGKSNVLLSAASVNPSVRHASGGDYIQVNPFKPDNPSWKEVHDATTKSLFWTELFTGMGVSLGALFKEPATINYPF